MEEYEGDDVDLKKEENIQHLYILK
jgi:hypothetical protein